MAEITKIQTFLETDEDQDNDLVNIDHEEEYFPYTFNFHPFFTPSSSSSQNHQVISKSSSFSSSSCCLSEPESETHYPDCLFCYDDDNNNDEFDQMDYVTDLFQETRLSVNNNNHDDGDHELELGLRATGIESESDIEELTEVNDENNDTHVVNLDHFWECPSFDADRIVVHERNEQEGLSSVIDRIEEIPASSGISSDGDASVGAFEWEFLLAVNNLERDLDLETDVGEGGGFVYTPEFDTLIGQFVETVRALRGSPPAAKSFVDSLPCVVLNDDHEICAVCKDEILIEEKVTQLPCRHHYHGECIVPWLSIRNTCPVCRFELPTDDVDYERSKNRENDDDELRVGSGFELSP
uniref:E3 ubiquitin-protein ligase CIP8-like n=1 Tax=Erigeron canadensis TaxID=72917 RepID=UPI001CB9341E|nr:E3 ubiquitin-protein ligase CIP8-like [Erigeron canadensis]